MLEREEQAEDWFTREFLRRWKTYNDATTYEERLEALVLIRTPIAKPKPPKERPKKRSGSQWGKVKGQTSEEEHANAGHDSEAVLGDTEREGVSH